VITFALPKGRIFDEIVPLLAAAGIEVSEDPEKTRKLIVGTSRPDVRLVLVRASDVPTTPTSAPPYWTAVPMSAWSARTP
jgi:ATP phosphoribosyltransferase